MSRNASELDLGPLLTLAHVSSEQPGSENSNFIPQNQVQAMPALPALEDILNPRAPAAAQPAAAAPAEHAPLAAAQPAPEQAPEGSLMGPAEEEPWRSVYLDQNKQLKPHEQINLDKIDFERLERCVHKNQAEAEFDYASCARYGYHHKKKNLQKAFQYLKKSSKHDQGLPIADWVLFQYYIDDQIMTELGRFHKPRRYKSAIAHLKKAANAGLIVAQYDMAVIYETHPEYFTYEESAEEYRKVQAFYWYKKAADNGYPLAQYDLGVCYEINYGVPAEEQANRLALAQKYYALAKENGVEPVEEQEQRAKQSKKAQEAAAQESSPMQVSPAQNGKAADNSSSNNSSSSSAPAVPAKAGLTIDLTADEVMSSSSNSNSAPKRRRRRVEKPGGIAFVNAESMPHDGKAAAEDKAAAEGKAEKEMGVIVVSPEAPQDPAKASAFYFKQITELNQRNKASFVGLKKQQGQIDAQQKQIEFYHKCIAKQQAQLEDLEREYAALNNQGSELAKSLEGNEMLLDMPSASKNDASDQEQKAKLEKQLVQSLEEHVEVQRQQAAMNVQLKSLLNESAIQKEQEVKLMKESLAILMNKQLIERQALVQVESQMSMLKTMKAAVDESLQEAAAPSRTFTPLAGLSLQQGLSLQPGLAALAREPGLLQLGGAGSKRKPEGPVEDQNPEKRHKA